MTTDDLMKLYEKEREYQKKVFGDYKNNPCLNISSFLMFLDNYLDKSKKFYTSKWTNNPPPWLKSTKEMAQQGSCPANTYEELIKIFVLAGAALESYTVIDPDKWREDGIKDKWKDPI
jgi:hypothetical protein